MNKTQLDALENHAQRLDGAAYFGHGTDNAWDEVAYLLLYVMQLPVDTPLDSIQRALTAMEEKQLTALIERRMAENIPAAYLTQETYFCGLHFYIDERALIPRSPIAELIHYQFHPWLMQAPKRLLELCTGSGCIAIATAMAFPEALVDATDIDPDALAVARINQKKHRLEQRLTLLQADLFTGITASQQYDLIIANPPYVDDEAMAALPKEYRHEPDHALRSPEQGLHHINRIIEQAKHYLTPNGLLVGEVGNAMETLINAHPTIDFLWPEFESGGHGVFIVTAAQLV